MNLGDLRKEYTQQGLLEDDMDKDPIRQFERWFQQALDGGIEEPNAMSLATVSPEGQPYQRTVLLKFFDTDGFVFYTNYGSRKSRQIEANAQVSLLFFWKELHRQVHITGQDEKVSRVESLRYFASRPRGSQLGAWVSAQSQIIQSRSLLMAQFEKIKERFAHGEVPLPDFWGGYRIVPTSLEFWQGRANRLHDRLIYESHENSWQLKRMSP
jgi:pyridoxamine 5'-phosphate oxidase